MFKKLISSRKGMALAIVLIVMTIVFVMGVIILQISLAETKFAARDENKMKAYYLARSGVEATVAWMLDPTKSGASLIGKTSADTPFQDGTFKVSVSTKSSTELLVKATGVVNGVSSRAAMILKKASASGGTPVFDNTIYAQQTLVLKGTTEVVGDVAAGTSLTKNSNSTVTSSTCPVTLDAPPIVFPDVPITGTDPNIGNKETFPLDLAGDEDHTIAYDVFTMNGGGTCIVKTGSTTESAVNLVVNKLNLKGGTLKIDGKGKLKIFVKGNSVFNADVNYNAPLSSNPDQLWFFIKPGLELSMESNTDMHCFIYGPGATLDLGGTRIISGAIFAGNVKTHGTLDVNGYDGGEDPITYDDLPVFFYTKGNWVNE